DGIRPILLKSCSFILSRPLWIIFNTSLTIGLFPNIWKTSLVTPLLKSGDPSDVRNYKQICKLDIIPKLFETLVVDALKSSVFNLVCPEQHGFTPTLSPTTNLAIFSHSVAKALDQNAQVDTIFVDFNKAFDSCCLARNRDELSVWRIIVINLFNYTWPPDRGTGPLARSVPPVERSRARWKVTRQPLGKTQKWGFSNVKQQSPSLGKSCVPLPRGEVTYAVESHAATPGKNPKMGVF
ncbi:hypothetical protein WH47_00565, partial [Habropoda laboriosa]